MPAPHKQVLETQQQRDHTELFEHCSAWGTPLGRCACLPLWPGTQCTHALVRGNTHLAVLGPTPSCSMHRQFVPCRAAVKAHCTPLSQLLATHVREGPLVTLGGPRFCRCRHLGVGQDSDAYRAHVLSRARVTMGGPSAPPRQSPSRYILRCIIWNLEPRHFAPQRLLTMLLPARLIGSDHLSSTRSQ